MEKIILHPDSDHYFQALLEVVTHGCHYGNEDGIFFMELSGKSFKFPSLLILAARCEVVSAQAPV